MRINKYIAQSTEFSRRAADQVIADGRVKVNGQPAESGTQINDNDTVTIDGRAITPSVKSLTILFNKPVGYVCSRQGQGSRTIYELLPLEYQKLQPVGRLDKDSSGLLLLSNDGTFANQLTHPSFEKQKLYEISLDRPLADEDLVRLNRGIPVEDYFSKLELTARDNPQDWQVSMHMGRNRQIRRTFWALGYTVTALHRTNFGPYELGSLKPGATEELTPQANDTEVG